MKIKILSLLLAVLSAIFLGKSQYETYNYRLNEFMKCPSVIRIYNYDVVLKHDEEGANEPKKSFHAKAVSLIDGKTGNILFEKNGEEKLAMASTTKVMTCILAILNGDFDTPVSVSEYAAGMPPVKLGMRKGDSYRLEDLLYSLMLESHNDVAVAIAEHVGGTVEGFARMMNEKAAKLGLSNTHFVTPNGLDADGHYTTANDLARLCAYAMKNEKFVKIINTKKYSFANISGNRRHEVYNHDLFLDMYEGANGIKTGYTGNAGYCFCGSAQRDDRHLIGVVLASGWPPDKTFKWKDISALMDYGFDNYHYQNETRVKEYPVILHNDLTKVKFSNIMGRIIVILYS